MDVYPKFLMNEICHGRVSVIRWTIGRKVILWGTGYGSAHNETLILLHTQGTWLLSYGLNFSIFIEIEFARTLGVLWCFEHSRVRFLCDSLVSRITSLSSMYPFQDD